MFCLLYSPKQKIVKFHAQKQIGKSHVIDIFTSEDIENISLHIFQYLTLYYIIKEYLDYEPTARIRISQIVNKICSHYFFPVVDKSDTSWLPGCYYFS
jgi:hypothetical protein